MAEISWLAEEAETKTNIDSHMGLIVKAKISILKEDKMSIQIWIRHFFNLFDTLSDNKDIVLFIWKNSTCTSRMI